MKVCLDDIEVSRAISEYVEKHKLLNYSGKITVTLRYYAGRFSAEIEPRNQPEDNGV